MFKIAKLLGTVFTGKRKTQKLDNNSLDSNTETFKATETKPIEGTPFLCSQKAPNQFIITMGAHCITNKTFNSRVAAEKFATQIDWWTVLNVIGIYTDNYMKERGFTKAKN